MLDVALLVPREESPRLPKEVLHDRDNSSVMYYTVFQQTKSTKSGLIQAGKTIPKKKPITLKNAENHVDLGYFVTRVTTFPRLLQVMLIKPGNF